MTHKDIIARGEREFPRVFGELSRCGNQLVSEIKEYAL
jgi:hypothetical protein